MESKGLRNASKGLAPLWLSSPLCSFLLEATMKESKRARIKWTFVDHKILQNYGDGSQLRLEFGELQSGEYAVDIRIWVRGKTFGIPTDDFVSTTKGIFLVCNDNTEVELIKKMFKFISETEPSKKEGK